MLTSFLRCLSTIESILHAGFSVVFPCSVVVISFVCLFRSLYESSIPYLLYDHRPTHGHRSVQSVAVANHVPSRILKYSFCMEASVWYHYIMCTAPISMILFSVFLSSLCVSPRICPFRVFSQPYHSQHFTTRRLLMNLTAGFTIFVSLLNLCASSEP